MNFTIKSIDIHIQVGAVEIVKIFLNAKVAEFFRQGRKEL